jgi:hypothetical protein
MKCKPIVQSAVSTTVAAACDYCGAPAIGHYDCGTLACKDHYSWVCRYGNPFILFPLDAAPLRLRGRKEK